MNYTDEEIARAAGIKRIMRYSPRHIYADSLSVVLRRAFGPALNAEAGRWQNFREKCL